MGVKLPEPLAEKVPVPLGAVAPEAEVSVTVALQDEAWSTVTGVEHETTVMVG